MVGGIRLHPPFRHGACKMQTKRDRKFLVRFWVTSLFVMIPVLIASIFITNKYIAKMEMSEKKQLEYQIENAAKYISTDFYEYINKSIILFSLKEFSAQNPFLETDSALNAFSLLRALFNFNNDEMLCVYYGNDKLYYAAGMESPEVYFEITLNCTEDSKKKGIQILESEERSINILHTKQGEGYLMYHIPIDKNLYGYSRSMQVYISFTSFANKMQGVLHGDEKLLTFFLGDERCYFYDDGNKIRSITVDEAARLQENDKWYQVQASDKNLNFSVEAAYDIDARLAELFELRNISVLILMTGMILSIVVSLSLGVIRFKKLDVLVNNIVNNKNTINRREIKKVKNEYEYLQEIFEDIKTQKEIVHDKNSILKRKMLRQVSVMMFQGVMRERDEIQNVLKLCGAELFQDFYYICGIKMDSLEGMERFDVLPSADIRYVYKGKYVLLFCEIPGLDYDMSKRKKIVEALRLFLKDNDIFAKRIVVGPVLNKIWPVDYSYLDVISILEDNTTKYKQVIFWEDWIQTRETSVNVGDKELFAFHEALITKDYELAEERITVIVGNERTQEEKENKILERFLIVRILINDLGIYDKRDCKPWLIDEVAHIDLLDETSFTRKIIKILQQYRAEDKKEVLFDKILLLIEGNCFNYDLSLEMLAEQTGVSKSWISKMLKNRMGVNYAEYVTQLRMNKAKELLTNTDMTIGEVFAAVGYIDNVTARKRFKEYFKMTPSEYVQKVKREKNIEGE